MSSTFPKGMGAANHALGSEASLLPPPQTAASVRGSTASCPRLLPHSSQLARLPPLACCPPFSCSLLFPPAGRAAQQLPGRREYDDSGETCLGHTLLRDGVLLASSSSRCDSKPNQRLLRLGNVTEESPRHQETEGEGRGRWTWSAQNVADVANVGRIEISSSSVFNDPPQRLRQSVATFDGGTMCWIHKTRRIEPAVRFRSPSWRSVSASCSPCLHLQVYAQGDVGLHGCNGTLAYPTAWVIAVRRVRLCVLFVRFSVDWRGSG